MCPATLYPQNCYKGGRVIGEAGCGFAGCKPKCEVRPKAKHWSGLGIPIDRRRSSRRGYWGACTACPSKIHRSCNRGGRPKKERGCGFAGCQSWCE